MAKYFTLFMAPGKLTTDDVRNKYPGGQHAADLYEGNETLTELQWSRYARMALDEDQAHSDVTTGLLGDAVLRPGAGRLIAEGDFVVAGIPLVEAVFSEFADVRVDADPVMEGSWVQTGDVVATVAGPAGSLLAGERVALNYLQRLSGIATETRRAVDAVRDVGTAIVDTRKTTPGLRELEKYAVRIAGGLNHRFSLADAVLWKDNHWSLLRATEGKLGDALGKTLPGLTVQVEIEREDQLHEVVQAGVKFVLIDNQPPETIKRWAAVLGPDVVIEASGGITGDQVRAYAEAGAQRVSMGSLTHSTIAAPISFEISFSKEALPG